MNLAAYGIVFGISNAFTYAAATNLGTFDFANRTARLNRSYTEKARWCPPSRPQCNASLDAYQTGVTQPFPYMIPYGTNQLCDIYGPLCQSGTITVKSNAGGSSFSLTTMPCSAYLASQSAYLHDFGVRYFESQAVYPPEWMSHFGRSPQCWSYVTSWGNNTGSPWTFSECPGHQFTSSEEHYYYALPTQVPPGVITTVDANKGVCCGVCDLVGAEVTLHYFKGKDPRGYCKSRGRTYLGSNESLASSLAGSVAVVRGITLTSPSILLEITGTISISDECGSVGGSTSGFLIAADPSEVSTWQPYEYHVGDILTPMTGVYENYGGTVDAFNPMDLECPTFGVGLTGITQAQNSTLKYYGATLTIGPPWQPFFIPPRQFYETYTMWNEFCRFRSFGRQYDFLFIDPSKVITSAIALVPGSVLPSAFPGQVITPDSPIATTGYKTQETIMTDDLAATSLRVGGSANAEPSGTGQSSGSAIVGRSSRPQQTEPTGNPEVPKPGSVRQKVKSAFDQVVEDPGIPNDASSRPSAEPGSFNSIGRTTGSPAQESAVQSHYQGAERPLASTASIYVANPRPLPTPRLSTPSLMDQGAITGDTQVPQSSALGVSEGFAVPAEGSIAYQSSQTSLSNIMQVNSLEIIRVVSLLPSDQAAAKTANLVMVGGEIFTANSEGFAIHGSSISPGSDAVDVRGTQVSLGADGVLKIGYIQATATTATPKGENSIGSDYVTSNSYSDGVDRTGDFDRGVGTHHNSYNNDNSSVDSSNGMGNIQGDSGSGNNHYKNDNTASNGSSSSGIHSTNEDGSPYEGGLSAINSGITTNTKSHHNSSRSGTHASNGTTTVISTYTGGSAGQDGGRARYVLLGSISISLYILCMNF